MIKKIGVLTSGGDAPGMNAAVRGVVKAALNQNIETYIIKDGYKGMVNGWFEKATEEKVDTIISKSGTSIGSARLPEFAELKVREQAIKQLQKVGIEAVVVIGGDGSFKGALKLTEMGINCIGIPGTIDNDITSSDLTIGFDSALNTVVTAIDQIRETMESHNRCAVIEVMGNLCGDLAIVGGIAAGADIISYSEKALTKQQIIKAVKERKDANKRSVIVLVSENIYDSHALAKKIEQEAGYITRATILGHIQRGPKPTAIDRYIASIMGLRAVEELINGNGGICIGMDGTNVVTYDITKALAMPRPSRKNMFEQAQKLNAYRKK